MPIRNPNQKLNDSKDMPSVQDVSPEMAAKYGGVRMCIASPLNYDELMKRVPKGKLITIDRMRAYLANKNHADWTCQITAGIFVNIAANASEERKGVNETPYWRTLKKDGELCEKFPGGLDGHKLLLETEGHTVFQKGKRYFVENYEKDLYELK